METTRTSKELQQVPVKMFRTVDRLTVAAPMPGLLPEDIVVEVGDGRLTLHGEQREARKPDGLHEMPAEPREVLLDEWSVGGYHRELPLPIPVDGELATLTYGNGVLVAALPVTEQTRMARLSLVQIGPGYGERVGSAGHPIQPLTTDEHLEVKHSGRSG